MSRLTPPLPGRNSNETVPVARLLLGAGGAAGPYKAKSSAADRAGRDRGSDAGTDVPGASEEQKAKSSVHVDVDLHLD